MDQSGTRGGNFSPYVSLSGSLGSPLSVSTKDYLPCWLKNLSWRIVSVGRFFTTDLIDVRLCRRSIIEWAFVLSVFQGVGPFQVGCWTYGHTVVPSILAPLYLHGLWRLTSFLSFLVSVVFFSWPVYLQFCRHFWISKKQFLVSLIFLCFSTLLPCFLPWSLWFTSLKEFCADPRVPVKARWCGWCRWCRLLFPTPHQSPHSFLNPMRLKGCLQHYAHGHTQFRTVLESYRS